MAEQSTEPSKGADNTDSASVKSLFSDVIWMASAFWVSRQRNTLLALAGGLIVVVGATAYMQIRLNSWNRPFYNALTNKDMAGFRTKYQAYIATQAPGRSVRLTEAAYPDPVEGSVAVTSEVGVGSTFSIVLIGESTAPASACGCGTSSASCPVRVSA